MFIKFLVHLVIGLILYSLLDIVPGGLFVLTIFLFVIALICTVIISVWGVFSKNIRPYIKYGLSVCLGLSIQYILIDHLAAYQAELSRVTGDEIISAIQESYSNQGEYVDSLATLVPNYLDEIPTTKTGYGLHEFHYVKFDRGFDLWFEGRDWEIHKYSSTHNEWIVTD